MWWSFSRYVVEALLILFMLDCLNVQYQVATMGVVCLFPSSSHEAALHTQQQLLFQSRQPSSSCSLLVSHLSAIADASCGLHRGLQLTELFPMTRYTRRGSVRRRSHSGEWDVYTTIKIHNQYYKDVEGSTCVVCVVCVCVCVHGPIFIRALCFRICTARVYDSFFMSCVNHKPDFPVSVC